MDQNYSTLELVEYDETARAAELTKHDETAKAPERDYDATAFELDLSALAPEIVLDTEPQVVYNASFPEVHDNQEESTKERTPRLGITMPRLKWPFVILAFVIAAAIAVGVGVGIWRSRLHKSQYILNDTSLAALIFANGDRQLFYQDHIGLIRRVVRSASNNQWSTSSLLDSDCNVCNPKNLTPLAVTVIEGTNGFPPQATLYYVSESHFLSFYDISDDPNTSLSILTNYSTAVNTRSLSVTTTASGSNTSSTTMYLLFYENPTGEVSALLQRTTGPVGPGPTQWVDISSQEVNSLPDEFRNPQGGEVLLGEDSHTLYESQPNATFGAPFASRANFSAFLTGPQSPFGALFYSPLNASLGTFFDIDISVGPSGPGNFSVITVCIAYPHIPVIARKLTSAQILQVLTTSSAKRISIC